MTGWGRPRLPAWGCGGGRAGQRRPQKTRGLPTNKPPAIISGKPLALGRLAHERLRWPFERWRPEPASTGHDSSEAPGGAVACKCASHLQAAARGATFFLNFFCERSGGRDERGFVGMKGKIEGKSRGCWRGLCAGHVTNARRAPLYLWPGSARALGGEEPGKWVCAVGGSV